MAKANTINDLYVRSHQKLSNWFGSSNVDDVLMPTMGSEDFGFFGELFPVAQIRVGTRFDDDRSKLPLHNPRIIFSEESIANGILAGCALVLDHGDEITK